MCSVKANENFPSVSGPESRKILTKGVTKRMVQTIQKNIRVTPEQWKHVEKEAIEREVSPNRLVVELAIEALKHREWPRTEAEIHLLRSAMFTAQAIIRDMEKAGREEEIEQISRTISEVAPELPGGPMKLEHHQPQPPDFMEENACADLPDPGGSAGYSHWYRQHMHADGRMTGYCCRKYLGICHRV